MAAEEGVREEATGDAMAAAASREEEEEEEIPFSFMDKVKFMMYGEQEKEAFLIEKKEKEEKKKAKKALKEQKKNQKKDPSSGKVKGEEEAAWETTRERP